MNSRTPGWNFFSNHAHVLLVLAEQPDARLRDIAERVGITERAVHSIVTALEAEGAITRNREGRRIQYEIHADMKLRHPVEAHRSVGDLVGLFRQDKAEQQGEHRTEDRVN